MQRQKSIVSFLTRFSSSRDVLLEPLIEIITLVDVDENEFQQLDVNNKNILVSFGLSGSSSNKKN